jgi:hypothetical protein
MLSAISATELATVRSAAAFATRFLNLHNSGLMATRQPDFSFHIEANGPHLHAVPADVLVQILEHAQRAFQLIGLHVEGRGIKQRARIARSTSDRFQLICQVPKAGSYAVPVEVGARNELFDEAMAKRATQIFEKLMRRISQKSANDLFEVLPDQLILRRVLEAVKGMSPRADATWTLELRDAGDQAFASFDSTVIPFLQETLVPPGQREAERVVTGELKSIDFAAHKLTIIYRPTSRELDCLYDESLEDLLYERRRDLIQVTGRLLLDEGGNPKQIIDVTDIADLDLSPLVLGNCRFGDRVLEIAPPLVLQPTMDDSEQLLCVLDEQLGVDAFASTRETLFSEIAEQLDMLWHEYALAEDDALDPVALQRKCALQSRMREVKNAA